MDYFFKGLSIWAALVSTGLGLIQIGKWRKTRVRVEVSIKDIHQRDEHRGTLEKLDGTFLSLQVINHLDHAITVTSVSFVSRMRSTMSAAVLNIDHAESGIHWRLPIAIPAHSAQQFPMPWDPIRRNLTAVKDGGAHIEVRVATGETYRSRVLMPTEGDASCAEHDRRP